MPRLTLAGAGHAIVIVGHIILASSLIALHAAQVNGTETDEFADELTREHILSIVAIALIALGASMELWAWYFSTSRTKYE